MRDELHCLSRGREKKLTELKCLEVQAGARRQVPAQPKERERPEKVRVSMQARMGPT